MPKLINICSRNFVLQRDVDFLTQATKINESLILAQDECWRRALGMQVERGGSNIT